MVQKEGNGIKELKQLKHLSSKIQKMGSHFLITENKGKYCAKKFIYSIGTYTKRPQKHF